MDSYLTLQNISPEDLGLQFGFSLFETFLVGRDCKIFLLDRHIDRLSQSMGCFNIDINMHKAEFRKLIVNYIQKNRLNGKVLRVTVTSGNRQKGIAPSILFTSRENPYTQDLYNKGLKLMVASFRKNETSPLVMHKTGNCLESYMACNTALSKGYDDSLFMNSKGEMTETTKCNLFFVSRGILHTPALSCGLLPGIIRGWITEKASSLGINCIQGRYSPESFADMDEVFATNSVMGIMPVVEIEGYKTLTIADSSITKLLMKEYNEAANQV